MKPIRSFFTSFIGITLFEACCMIFRHSMYESTLLNECWKQQQMENKMNFVQNVPPKGKLSRPRRRIPVKELKVSTPIIVLSLPKSGTSSLFHYFNCGGVYSAHTYAQDNTTKSNYRLGRRFYSNYKAGLPLLTNTGKYKVFTDIGTVDGENNCFYPSVDALDNIAKHYPHATLIVSHRPGWYQSIATFKSLGKRWKNWCPSFPNTTDVAEWENFYSRHRERIRELVQAHPTLTLLEFDLTDPTAGQQLENFTGISAHCWGDCKPTMRCRYETTMGKGQDKEKNESRRK